MVHQEVLTTQTATGTTTIHVVMVFADGVSEW